MGYNAAMRFRFTIRDLLCLAVVGLPAIAFAQAENEIKPYVSFWGSDSRIDKPTYQLVTSRKEWTDLWLRHMGKSKHDNYSEFYNPDNVPDVNFEKLMVVAVFAGKSFNSAGIEFVSCTDGKDQMTVRFREKGYGTAGKADDATPYGLFVLNRSAKSVIVEQDVRSIKNEPPVSKEVARFQKQ